MDKLLGKGAKFSINGESYILAAVDDSNYVAINTKTGGYWGGVRVYNTGITGLLRVQDLIRLVGLDLFGDPYKVIIRSYGVQLRGGKYVHGLRPKSKKNKS